MALSEPERCAQSADADMAGQDFRPKSVSRSPTPLVPLETGAIEGERIPRHRDPGALDGPLLLVAEVVERVIRFVDLAASYSRSRSACQSRSIRKLSSTSASIVRNSFQGTV